MSSSLCHPTRFEVPTGPREPHVQAELVGLQARNPEDGLTRLPSPGDHESNQPVKPFWSMQRMPSAPQGSLRHQGEWFLF